MFLTPEFFDIFGILGFLTIIAFSTWEIVSQRRLPRWAILVLLGIGILGFMVDLTIVYAWYLR